MNIEAIKHNFLFETKLGRALRSLITWAGLKMLRGGRKLLKKTGQRCSWCGRNCGFDSTVSGKGVRCSGLTRDCTDKPDV